MSKRYIDADALLKTINKNPAEAHNERCAQILEAILYAPTADVKEVRHGSFVWIADDSPMCNICGKVFDTDDNVDAGLWKFCPECGADMRGTNDGEE